MFELCFAGSAGAKYFPRYKRFHNSIAAAQVEANQVLEKLETIHHPQGGSVAGFHDPIVYGPGCGDAGKALRWL